MSESKALAPLDPVPEATQADKAALRVVEGKERLIIRRLRRIVEQGALDGSHIDDDGPAPVVPEGQKPWTPDRLRVARDMRKSKRNAPVYLEHAQRAVEKHDDRQAVQQVPTQLNVGVINIVQARVYPAIELETKE